MSAGRASSSKPDAKCRHKRAGKKTRRGLRKKRTAAESESTQDPQEAALAPEETLSQSETGAAEPAQESSGEQASPDSTDSNTTSDTPCLLPQHQKLIDDSLIDPAVATERGYRSVEVKAELMRLGFSDYQCRVPALLVPVFSVYGEIATYQLRPDEPRIDKKKGKALKYETLAGRRVFLDVHPRARKNLGNPQLPLFIAEGVRKADAAVSKGLCCIDVLGVWNWRGTNEHGGKVALPDWEVVALKDRKVYIVFDSDVVQKESVHGALVRLKGFLEGHGAEVLVIYLPNAEGGVKVGLDDFLAQGKSVDDLLAYASTKIQGPERDASSGEQAPYLATPQGLVWLKTGKVDEYGDTVRIRLTNFSARIISDVCRDEGLETQHTFVIEAKQGERDYRFDIPAISFVSMGWPTEKLGASAIVYPGQGIRDHTRTAIQTLSNEHTEQRIYVHSGWIRQGDEWVYLHGGGAIGTIGTISGVEVDLEGSLEGLVLPPPPAGEELRQVIRQSLDLRSLGKAEVIDPLLCFVYRAPLASIAPLDFSLALTGPTGVFKTEVAGIAQGFFGAAFNGRTLPGSWKSTANSLERLLFIAKDALVTVDDFAPGGNANEVSRYHREADNLLRGVGNRSGRGRLRPDGTARPVYRPRGATLTTGEDVPRGHSLRARMLILEMSPGDIAVPELTEAQGFRDSGVYAAAMSGYIQWLASRLESLKEDLLQLRSRLRAQPIQDGSRHRRVSDIVASLLCGLHAFLRFAKDTDAISENDVLLLTRAVEASLGEAASRQSDHHNAEEPTARFLQLLGGALTSGRAHFADVHTGREPCSPERYGWHGVITGKHEDTDLQWRSQGDRIGWVDGEDILLEPEAAFAAIQELSREQGTSLPVGQKTLWKRMAEKGLLASSGRERSRNVVRWTVVGERREVIHLLASTLGPLSSQENVPIVPNVPDPPNSAGLGRFSVGRKSGDPEKTSQQTVPKSAAEPATGPIGTNGTIPGDIGGPGERERGVL